MNKIRVLCSICKKELKKDDYSFDHIVPINKGGTKEGNNLQLTCKECNMKKSDKM